MLRVAAKLSLMPPKWHQGKYDLHLLLDGEPIAASPIPTVSISPKMPQTLKFLTPRVRALLVTPLACLCHSL